MSADSGLKNACKILHISASYSAYNVPLSAFKVARTNVNYLSETIWPQKVLWEVKQICARLSSIQRWR